MVRIVFVSCLLSIASLPSTTLGIRFQIRSSKATKLVVETSQAIDHGTSAAYWLRQGFRTLFNEMKKRVDDTLTEHARNTARQTSFPPSEFTRGVDLNSTLLPLGNSSAGQGIKLGGDHTLGLTTLGSQVSVAYSPSLNSVDMSMRNSDDSTNTAIPRSATYSARLERADDGTSVTRYKSRRVVKSARAKTKWDGEPNDIDFTIFDKEEAGMAERLDFFRKHAMGRNVSDRGRRTILGLVNEIAPQLALVRNIPTSYDVDDELYDRGMKIALGSGHIFKVEISPADYSAAREAVLILERPGRTSTVKVNAVPANDSVRTTLGLLEPKGFAEGVGFIIHELEISDDASKNTRLSTAISDISVRPAPPKPGDVPKK